MDIQQAADADVALLDFDLGVGPTGIDLAHALRERQPALGIVILSTYKDPRLLAPGTIVPGSCETHRPADLTHLLRTDPALPSLADYARQISEPVDPAVIGTTILWLDAVLQG